jgi:formylglycine-generating enzyme required for sulfatase activity
MARGWYLLFVLLLGSANRASAEASRVVVFPVDVSNLNSNLPRTTVSALDESFLNELVSALPSKKWLVVPPDEVLRSLAAAGLEPRDCGEAPCRIQTARDVKAARLLNLKLFNAGPDFRLEEEVYELRDGRVIASGQVTASLPGLVEAFSQQLEPFLQRAGLLAYKETAKVVEPPKPKVRKNRTDARSGLELAWFAGGKFLYGCEPKDQACQQEEEDTREVTLAPFWLTKTEVSTAQYERCVQAGGCSGGASNAIGIDRCNWNRRASHPMNCVSFELAREFCRWIGGDVPSAEEWEFAARDGGGRIYPWGNEEPSAELAQIDAEVTAPVGSHRKGASPAGVLDLIGNVAEWTRTERPTLDRMEVRGGAFNTEHRWLRVTARSSARREQGDDAVGFRCRLPDSK